MNDTRRQRHSASRSVGTSIHVFTGGVVVLSVALTLGLGYTTTVASMEDEAERSLELLMAARSNGESRAFLQAEQNVRRLEAELLERLARTGTDAEVEAQFDRLFMRSPEDGLWRVRPELNDFERHPTLYLQHDARIDASVRRRAVASYHLLDERGPAIVPPQYSVYMDFVEKGLMVYSPHVDWGGHATRETNNFNYPTMVGSNPERNPERSKFWTPVYFDEEAGIWMVSVIEPLDWQGEWVGTIGHDVAIDELMKSTLNERLEGTYNIILSLDGQLIVHPNFTDQIREAKGDLSLHNLDDPQLDRIAALALLSGAEPVVVDDPEGDYWYGIAPISGPGWRLVTVYPRAIVSARATRAIYVPLGVGVIILLAALVTIRVVVRRVILTPLGHMDAAVAGVGGGGQVSRVPIESDDEFGRLARSFESMADNLRNREQSLVEARLGWERTFDAVPEMLAIIDQDMRIRQVNRAFAERHQDRDVVDEIRTDVVPAEEREPIRAALAEVSEHRRPVQFTYESSALDGTFEVVLAPIFDDDGELTGAIEVAHDVTARLRLEEELRHAQKMEAIGHLAGGVAHDFNNLLQVIMGYAAGLQDGLAPDSQASHDLGEVLNASEQAAALTRQLLAFSRRQVIAPTPTDLGATIGRMAKMIERLIGEHVELEFIAPKQPCVAAVDPHQIQQVVLNLCVNARDAMPHGGRLTIELGAVDVDEALAEQYDWALGAHFALLRVADSGAGIPEHLQARIFEPFFTTKDEHKGTGLGLATVYGIVHQHGGEIELDSETGVGSTFRIYLPLLEKAPVIGVPTGDEPVVGGDECILVAEDDEQVRRLVQRFLAGVGYRVLLAADGEEALDVYRARRGEVDLLLLDVIMPKVSGREVYETIRGMDPEIRCLFASGYSEDALHTDFRLDAGLHLVEKPYQRRRLLRSIRSILDAPVAASK